MKIFFHKWLWFLLLLILSGALRLFGLEMGFWMDEIITVTQFVPSPWLKIITEVPYPNNHILYTLLAKLAIDLFGEKEWAARLPAMIFGTVTAPVVYSVLRKRFSNPASFATGLFLALNFWSVWFSQDARGYSALILFGFLSNWLFLEYPERGDQKSVFAYILVSVLCVWFYLYGIFLVAGQLFWALLRGRGKNVRLKNLVPVLISGILGISLYLPGLAQIYHYGLSQRQMARLHPLNLLFFKDLLMMLAGSRNLVITAGVCLLALPGFFYLAKKWPGFLAINLAGALGILTVTALSGFFIYPRFLIFLLPLFGLCFGLSLEFAGVILKAANNFLRAAVFTILIFLMVLLLAPGLVNYYLLGKQGFKDSAVYLQDRHPPESVICYGIICKELAYYYHRPMLEVSEKKRLTPELIRGKVIISRRVDWTQDNLELVGRICYPEQVWRSSGYPENILVLFNCK